jgi:transposase InsO family protein
VFRVRRSDELWHLDMTSIWGAEPGWCYRNAIIDCCTREISGWSLVLRCRAEEDIACVEHAVLAHGMRPHTLTLGIDNGSAFTSRAFCKHLSARGVTHRRGGYCDPESQAFIESVGRSAIPVPSRLDVSYAKVGATSPGFRLMSMSLSPVQFSNPITAPRVRGGRGGPLSGVREGLAKLLRGHCGGLVVLGSALVIGFTAAESGARHCLEASHRGLDVVDDFFR